MHGYWRGRAAAGMSVLLLMAVVSPATTAAAETPAPVGTMTPTADGMVFKAAIPTRSVVFVQDGVYVPQAGAAAVLSAGVVSSAAASGVRIASAEDNLNAVYVTGEKSRYTLANARIELSGNGSDDMSGIAAAALVS